MLAEAKRSRARARAGIARNQLTERAGHVQGCSLRFGGPSCMRRACQLSRQLGARGGKGAADGSLRALGSDLALYKGEIAVPERFVHALPASRRVLLKLSGEV